MEQSKSFSDYKQDAHNWITLANGEYYPDILKDACELYKPVLVMFGQLVRSSESSSRLLEQISEVKEGWMRIQLARVFRKYVSPQTPVEMLKKKRDAQKIIEQFGENFRAINIVQEKYRSRPIPDEALSAVLWEYKDRGKKGYDLTERFFSMFKEKFPRLVIKGPERAGADVLLGKIFKDYPHLIGDVYRLYPNEKRPVDFVIYDEDGQTILAIGLARYDSDRGGAQEDDRTGGYRNCADEILVYAERHNLNIKVIFVNDGPGLLLGSMWNDYASIENSWAGKIKVVTLRMVPERITLDWLRS